MKCVAGAALCKTLKKSSPHAEMRSGQGVEGAGRRRLNEVVGCLFRFGLLTHHRNEYAHEFADRHLIPEHVLNGQFVDRWRDDRHGNDNRRQFQITPFSQSPRIRK